MNRLKYNKDLEDYAKTKKYKYNYPHTNYYPKVKFIVNPNYYASKHNTRLVPYKRDRFIANETYVANETDWKPVLYSPTVVLQNISQIRRSYFYFRPSIVKRNRAKRSIHDKLNFENKLVADVPGSSTGLLKLFFGLDLLGSIPNKNTKSILKHSVKFTEPPYYTMVYEILMMTLQAMEGLFEAAEAMEDHLFGNSKMTIKKKKRIPIKHVNQTNVTDIINGKKCNTDL